MKPLRLTLQAFGPYPGRTIVDFRAALASGLFGIYGATGSGKSTLFSAMSFALFGETAKGDKADEVRADMAAPDVLTEVELVFDVGPRRYVALRRPRQMRPAKRGGGATEAPPEAWLFDATGLALEDLTPDTRGTPLAERKLTDVAAAVQDVLGYSGEEFRQIVLLPQGQFERFLAAKTDERQKILRELFDVSLYRALTDDLTAAAKDAEARIKLARAAAAAQLSAEGFESLEALASGIAEAQELSLAEARAAEAATRTAHEATAALTAAERIAETLERCDQARAALADITARQPQIDALSAQVAEARRAAALADADQQQTDARRDAAEAAQAHSEAEQQAGMASDRADKAAQTLAALREDDARIAALSRQLDALSRHRDALDAAQTSAAALRAAQKADAAARQSEQTATKEATRAAQALEAAEAALDRARDLQARHAELGLKMAKLDTEQGAARRHDTAAAALAQAETEAVQSKERAAAARDKAEAARARFAKAENALSEAQAVHLAAHLEPGTPCPVCGSAAHPAPASGTAEDAGRDQAFRAARTALQEAEDAARTAASEAATCQVLRADRAEALGALSTPPRPLAEVAADVSAAGSALRALGPEPDPQAAQVARDGAAAQIRQSAAEAERARRICADAAQDLASCRTAHEAQLASVPAELQTPGALTRETARVTAEHGAATTQREAAETEDRTAREAQAAAHAAAEAARSASERAAQRLRRVEASFAARLSAAGLTPERYTALLPMLQTLADDEAHLSAHAQALHGAEGALRAAEAEASGLTLPDIAALRNAQRTARSEEADALRRAERAEARLTALERLAARLDQTRAELDAEEAQTGPLRGLAEMTRGTNPASMKLETFALAAMFDLVLTAANARLGPMTSERYRLERAALGGGRGQRGLEIQAFDAFTGRPRPTSQLSGGETFIAALALALGLADVVQAQSGKVRLDTIFIDEGFGSLDAAGGAGTLGQVLDVLTGLVAESRAVGLISHVGLVQEMIPNGFAIETGPEGSRVIAKEL